MENVCVLLLYVKFLKSCVWMFFLFTRGQVIIVPSYFFHIGLSSSDQIQFYCHTSVHSFKLTLTSRSPRPPASISWYINAEPDNDNLGFYFWQVDLVTLSSSRRKGTLILGIPSGMPWRCVLVCTILGPYVPWTTKCVSTTDPGPHTGGGKSQQIQSETWVIPRARRVANGNPSFTHLSDLTHTWNTSNILWPLQSTVYTDRNYTSITVL